LGPAHAEVDHRLAATGFFDAAGFGRHQCLKIDVV
jgi:hypothetical protein